MCLDADRAGGGNLPPPQAGHAGGGDRRGAVLRPGDRRGLRGARRPGAAGDLSPGSTRTTTGKPLRADAAAARRGRVRHQGARDLRGLRQPGQPSPADSRARRAGPGRRRKRPTRPAAASASAPGRPRRPRPRRSTFSENVRPMRDSLYEKIPFQLAELRTRYGANVHLVGNPFLLSQLATLCAKGTASAADQPAGGAALHGPGQDGDQRRVPAEERRRSPPA